MQTEETLNEFRKTHTGGENLASWFSNIGSKNMDKATLDRIPSTLAGLTYGQIHDELGRIAQAKPDGTVTKISRNEIPLGS